MQILNKAHEALLNEERDLLNQLRLGLAQFGGSAEDQGTLAQSIAQLDDLFLLVVVGEFNAGKSAIINALLGQSILKEGVTPTTTRINLLKYGETQEWTTLGEDLDILTAPVELLSEISIVDTPGTNTIVRAHETLTSQFVPRSDLVLFITSADRPFTESERAFLEKIRDWGKKIVVVLNKIDILQEGSEVAQAIGYIADNAYILLDITPEIFPVSARAALRAKQGETALWADSRFQPLEHYIFETLDQGSRVRLKLLNPLGVGLRLVENYLAIIKDRLSLLQVDQDTLADIEAQLAIYHQDMLRDFEFRLSDIENVLYEMDQRGQGYFDRTIRLTRLFDLMKKERFQKEIESEIVGDVPQRIERKVNELIDWLVESDLRQWQAVTERLVERRKQHQDRILGDSIPGSFHSDRARLIEELTREARQVVESYDKTEEARKIAEGTQVAVAAAAALEVSAVGLGAMIAILASTAAADITGLLLAGVVAALGLVIIPARRRQAKAELHQKVTDLQEKLMKSLRGHFNEEIQRGLGRIHEAMAPYSRFVRAERDKLEQSQANIGEIRYSMIGLQRKIEGLK